MEVFSKIIDHITKIIIICTKINLRNMHFTEFHLLRENAILLPELNVFHIFCLFSSPRGPQLILIINCFPAQLRHRESLSKANESFLFYEGRIYATAPNSSPICRARLGASDGIKRDPAEMACFITGSAAKLFLVTKSWTVAGAELLGEHV